MIWEFWDENSEEKLEEHSMNMSIPADSSNIMMPLVWKFPPQSKGKRFSIRMNMSDNNRNELSTNSFSWNVG